MRHNKAVNHLGRKSGHRKALLANMASSLILHKRIITTEAKAKALKPYLEPLITKSKEDTTHNRRVVFSYLKDKNAVSELFRTIAPKVADRPGGYLRILHVGFRQGDAAEMALIEFVDFNEAALAGSSKKEAKKTTRRSRAKKAEAAPAEAPAAEAPAEAPAEEAKAE
ncbi:MAG: 50S ribosomal protein L17 [Bacteroidales bacterium]|nr:50S ribosomal protein L17 [Bacteroidales bacterium]